MAELSVVHRNEASRFELKKDGHTAVLDYRIEGDKIRFYHTGVPGPLEGQGIGKTLVIAGLDFAKKEELQVIPQCWFVAGYIQRHPEWKTLVAKS